ncbi:hypothetical protein MesoLj113b_72750 (plasmid) [Mesorhizobium sp. 113-3-3]|nr:hypothetical protein MesoLj113b_72750 [Mesorhizobium sp. 113-3-3]
MHVIEGAVIGQGDGNRLTAFAHEADCRERSVLNDRFKNLHGILHRCRSFGSVLDIRPRLSPALWRLGVLGMLGKGGPGAGDLWVDGDGVAGCDGDLD